MKKFLIFVVTVLAVSCAKNEDASLLERMSSVEARISELQETLDIMNQDAAALKEIVDAFSNGSTVSEIIPRYSDGILTGYEVVLTDGSSFIIRNGMDGEDGYCGRDGIDGHTPLIGVTLIDGRYYWTIDSELLRDGQGNPVPASPDPSQSTAKDGETPVVSVENGQWIVTVGGQSYVVGKVSDTDKLVVDGVFASVMQTDTEVTFTLSDGTVITLPKTSVYCISLSVTGLCSLSYTVTGSVSSNNVDVLCEKGWTAAVVPSTPASGTITVTPDDKAPKATFVVLCNDGEHNAVTSFSITTDGIITLL